MVMESLNNFFMLPKALVENHEANSTVLLIMVSCQKNNLKH